MSVCEIITFQPIGMATPIAMDTSLLFCGAIGFLSFFIGLIFLKTKDRIYFYYFLFLLFSLAGGLFHLERGIKAQPSFLESAGFTGAGLELVTLLAFSAYCFFTIRLLEIGSQNKRLFYWIRIMAISGILYGILYCFIRPALPENRLLFFIFSRLVILFMSMVAILWVVMGIRSPVKSYFVLGSCWYFSGALFAILRDTTSGLLPSFFYRLDSMSYFYAGIFLEVVSFTLALTYRTYIFYEERNRNQTQINTLAINEKEIAQAEALALRTQINPHFLFNYLNVIKYYIQINQNREAIQYLIKFSQFIRKTLDSNQYPTISLEQELNMTEHYLALEKIRFNKNFSYNIKIDKEIDIGHLIIPPMLLQPFVEEALWNGIQSNGQTNSKITITLYQSDASLTILIEGDDGGKKIEAADHIIRSHKKANRQITMERIKLFNKNHDSKISYYVLTEEELKKENKNSRIIIKIAYPA